MNKKLLNKKDHIKWKNTSNPGARHEHYLSSGAVKSRFKESLKMPISQGQISAWVTWGIGRGFPQRILHDQRSSGGMATQYYWQWQLPAFWERGHSRENTTHNQRPARLTHLGKNKGFPVNQKGSGKNKGWNEKICTPGKSKTWKGGLGKNGYPDGLKTRKGGPGKN